MQVISDSNLEEYLEFLRDCFVTICYQESEQSKEPCIFIVDSDSQ